MLQVGVLLNGIQKRKRMAIRIVNASLKRVSKKLSIPHHLTHLRSIRTLSHSFQQILTFLSVFSVSFLSFLSSGGRVVVFCVESRKQRKEKKMAIIRIVNASLSKKLSIPHLTTHLRSSMMMIRTLSHSFPQILTFFCKFQNFSVFSAFHRLSANFVAWWVVVFY